MCTFWLALFYNVMLWFCVEVVDDMLMMMLILTSPISLKKLLVRAHVCSVRVCCLIFISEVS